MEANVWWLLAIPLFFGLGWLASRLDSAQLLTETRALPTSYFNGLNYLLAEQPDKAIVAFEEVARLDPETAELYFALGQLFRRRGEAERAIRIHKNLLKRADLPAAQREQALFELAQDFVAAGIFDHAENAFAQLAGTRYAAQAQRELAKLYEKEANWQGAITCAQTYLSSTPAPSAADAQKVSQDLAHYGCELTALHLETKALDAASAALGAARLADASNPRLPFLQAQLDFARQAPQVAMQGLGTALSSTPSLTVLALHAALQGLPKPLDSAALDTLFHWVLTTPSAAAVHSLTAPLLAADRQVDLNRLLNALAQHISNPINVGSLAGIRSLWSAAQAGNARDAETAAWTQAANAASDALIHRYDRPQCTACGFKASRHHWRCPGCGQWATLPYGA